MNINAWLRDNGYLHLKNGDRESGSFFEGVDWSRTRAYALGLGGFYLNMKGREAQGIVEARDADRLKAEIMAKLIAHCAMTMARRRSATFTRPNRSIAGRISEAAPDFIVGYNEGYRCSWEARSARLRQQVIEDNPKGLERRSLRGSRAGAWRAVLESQDRRRKIPASRIWRPPRFNLFGVDAPGLDGREAPFMMRKRWAVVACLALVGCGHPSPPARKKIIVLGIDAMDPGFLERHWDKLPNLDRLRRTGDFERLATTIPPQSPVAWSTFITGLDPGGHGVFDFIHRDPKTMEPLSSMADVEPPRHTLPLGPYLLPLSSGHVRRFLRGKAFWQLLDEAGVPATLLRMPNNFPPLASRSRSLSGMGTPDMRGTFGTFSYFTDDPGEMPRAVPGGRIVPVQVERDRAALVIEGPDNTLRKDRAISSVTMAMTRDATNPAALFEVDGQRVILRQGEWSGWVRVRFPIIPALKSAAGMFRVYAKGTTSGASHLRFAGQHRSVRTRPAHLYAAFLQSRTGGGYRAVLHAGHCRRHGSVARRRAHARGVPRADAPRRR